MTNQNNYVIPLRGSSAVDDSNLVGGKGGNLITLTRNGFNVPDGFIVTTNAYRLLIKENNLNQLIQKIQSKYDLSDPQQLTTASNEIRSVFERAKMPLVVSKQIKEAYHRMGSPAVAVRSSAITEDLPDLSFAGQHDTILNVTTLGGVMQAILTCFSSLWTARSMGYRHEHKITQDDLAMAVIVQKMIPSKVSGVMFTANPVTGKRREIVIEAVQGLGEALVSGIVEPDEYIIDEDDRVISKKIGKKELVIEALEQGGTMKRSLDDTSKMIASLDDSLALKLARIGRAMEKLYNHPQDIEWAIKDQEIFILQSRAITTLYPLPKMGKLRPLQVYMSFNALQGIMEPFTPLGMDVLQGVIKETITRFRLASHNFAIDTFMTPAGYRLWINMTPIVRDPLGRRVIHRGFLTIAEKDIRDIITDLLVNPDLQSARRFPFTKVHRQMMRITVMIWRRVLEALRNPIAVRNEKIDHLERIIQKIKENSEQKNTSLEKLQYNRSLLQLFPHVVLTFIPMLIAGYLPLALIQRLTSPHLKSGETDLLLELTRALPNNITTMMDLELWNAATTIKQDDESLSFLLTRSNEDLAAAWHEGTLPRTLQHALQEFLDKYWGRGLAEIDVGRPRWKEHPEPIFNALRAYVQLDENSPHAPSRMFRQGRNKAKTAYLNLRDKVKQDRGAWFKLHVMDGAVVRLRSLAGIREYPKFVIVRLFSVLRNNFIEIGRELVSKSTLDNEQDIFFLKIDEIERLLVNESSEETTTQVKKMISQRKAEYQREFYRNRVPKVLLSDGRMFFENPRLEKLGPRATILRGTGVSPGRHEGRVRVLLTPHEEQLLPGEILVCPATDPSWTPLFSAARGLIMEVGGLMTHGSVVAREMGIPAVVGVARATRILKTGQKVLVDGSKGILILKE